MKSIGTIEAGNGLWLNPNTCATNSSGFTGLPGGTFNSISFWGIGYTGRWWSSNEFTSDSGQCVDLNNEGQQCARFSDDKTSGLSVRCFKV